MMNKELLPFFSFLIGLSALAGGVAGYVFCGDPASDFRWLANTAEQVPGRIEDVINELRH
jgi:hypothetical protein